MTTKKTNIPTDCTVECRGSRGAREAQQVQCGFGSYLRAQRLAKGLTQRELARRIGIAFPYLSQIEHNVARPPAPDKLSKIARELGLASDALFARAGRIPDDVLKIFKQKPLEMTHLVREAGKVLSEGIGAPASAPAETSRQCQE